MSNPIYQHQALAIKHVQNRLLSYLAFKHDKAHPTYNVSTDSLLCRFQLVSLRSCREAASIFKLLDSSVGCPLLFSKVKLFVPSRFDKHTY